MPRANEVTSYTLNSGNASTAPIDALMSRSVNPVDNHLPNDPTNPRLRNFIGYNEFTLSPLHLEWIKSDEHIFPLEGHLLLSGNHTNGAGGRGQIRYSPEENVVGLTPHTGSQLSSSVSTSPRASFRTWPTTVRC